MTPQPTRSTIFPSTTLFRSRVCRNTWPSHPSEGENVRCPGETEEKNHDEVEQVGRFGVGNGIGNVAGDGAGGGEERAAEASTEPVASGAGTMERNRTEADRDRGGFARGKVRLQAESGFADVCGATAARVGVHVLLHRFRAGAEATVPGRSEARQFEDEGGDRGVREEVRGGRRGRDQDKGRQRVD